MSGSFLLSLCILKRTKNLFRRSLRYCSSFSTGDAFVPFDGLVSRRRHEAQKSMLVEVAGVKSASDLYQVCSEFGAVRYMFHYKTKTAGNLTREMILVEFKDSSSLKNALNDTISPSLNTSVIPVHSPLVWLAARNTAPSSKASDTSKFPILSLDENNNPELPRRLHQCSNVSEQIQLLYDFQKLTELGWRLRFFTCRQVEIALSGLFPRAAAFPFGSSVNSFGRRNCDLDMILELNDTDMQADNHRLVFQAKKSRSSANPRLIMQRHMEVISDLIDNFVPGCDQVRKILGARIPIIKYHQHFTGVECDLSMSNMSGFYMSEMLYIYGGMDPRVRPLVFTVRTWASERQITSPLAGRWITNFSLTLLVLFYLTRTSPPVVPPLQTLIDLAGACDHRETSGIHCTFLRDITSLPPSENVDSLETLLSGFFEFYDSFDFKERGLSIVNGNDFVKPEHRALYIQNPLERELNVSRNVTFEEIDRLSSEISNARYLFEDSSLSSNKIKSDVWGVLRFFGTTNYPVVMKAGETTAIDWKYFFTHESSATAKTSNSSHPSKSLQINLPSQIKRAKSKSPSPSNKSVSNCDSMDEFVNALPRTGNREQIIRASDLNGLVTKSKTRVGNKNSGKKKSKAPHSGKFMFKW